MNKAITNLAASVHARLLNHAKAEGRPVSELLQYYAMERFLYRLSRSEHAEQFVLKGALMLQFWGGPLTRATRDVDLLGRTTAEAGELVEIIRGCITVRVDDDGLLFDATSVSGEEIRHSAHYHGVRIRCRADLGAARIPIQIDVGFGDIITPGARKIVYPTLLDFDAPQLRGYTPETSIAEKFHAMVVLDMANTRLKDFLDIWVLAQGKEFKGEIVAAAIEATFLRRRTQLPEFTPVALTAAFHSASAKQTQWRAYLRKNRIEGEVPPLDEVTNQIQAFVMPAVDALVAGRRFAKRWSPGGPWQGEHITSAGRKEDTQTVSSRRCV